MPTWTAEDRLKASKRASEQQQRIAADPNAHPLKQARAKRDLTQAETAALSGVHPQTISNAEQGGNVSRYVKDRLARALAVPVEDLFP
jgi:DNA-binding XRE family transcriptional regulator